MTGVIVRSSANVQAGARTRLSTILHGGLLLLCVVMLPGMLQLVPTAALAGVLVVTGWRLVSLQHVRDLKLHHGWVPAAIWAVTLIGVVGFDLLTGVLAGVALSVLESVPVFSRFVFRIRRSETPNGIELRLLGTGSFVHLPQLLAAVESAPPDRELRIRTRGLRFMDHTFAHALHEWTRRSDSRRKVIVG
jgi:MFS superfamily sulfate permease-like transporter